MIRFPLVACLCFSFGCGPTPQPSATTRVGAAALVDHVRDSGDKAYRGCRVQIHVPAKSYSVEGNRINYFTGLPGTKPVIVFLCLDPQTDASTSASLIVTGICRGAVYDGERKADRVAFVVRVEECHVTRIE